MSFRSRYVSGEKSIPLLYQMSPIVDMTDRFAYKVNNHYFSFLFHCYLLPPSGDRAKSGELKSQLYRSLDNKYISQEKFDDLYSKADKPTKKITAFITYLNA